MIERRSALIGGAQQWGMWARGREVSNVEQNGPIHGEKVGVLSQNGTIKVHVSIAMRIETLELKHTRYAN